MGVKTAQVWRESKLARETLRRCGQKLRLRAKCCVLQGKRLQAGAKVGVVGRRLRAVAGGCGAGFALCPGEFPMAGVFRGRG